MTATGDRRDQNPELWDSVYTAQYAAAEGLPEDRRRFGALNAADRAVAGIPFWSSAQVRNAVQLRLKGQSSLTVDPPAGRADNP